MIQQDLAAKKFGSNSQEDDKERSLTMWVILKKRKAIV